MGTLHIARIAGEDPLRRIMLQKPEMISDDDHEEGEISDDDEDYPRSRIESPPLAPAEEPQPSNETHNSLNLTPKEPTAKDDDQTENSLQTVVKLINNVTVGNACKSVNDACAQLHEALHILSELASSDAATDSIPSLVAKIVDRIRIVYCVYNATADEQKPLVSQSLVKLAALYSEKLFTPNQLQELKTLLQALKIPDEDKAGTSEHEYIPWDGTTHLVTEEPPASSSSDPLKSYSSYMSASYPMDDLPSPTPSEDDEAARYRKPVPAPPLQSKNNDSQPILKSRDPRRSLLEDNGRKREAPDLPGDLGFKKRRLDEPVASTTGSGGWLDPDVNEVGPQDNVEQIMMKPRDPRRSLLETPNVKPRNGVDAAKAPQNTSVLPQKGSVLNIPQHLMQKLKDLVEVVGNANGAVKAQPDNLKTGVPEVDNLPASADNGASDFEMHPELQDILEGLDDAERTAFIKERQRRMQEQETMLSARKLCLVLDLDHTLLNSAKFNEIEPEWEQFLRATEALERTKDGKEGPRRELYRFPHMSMWTKLRPGIWRFLARATQLYELHLYTMGNKAYATEMAKLLDPTGALFAGRVISKGDDGDAQYGDEKVPRNKDLDGVMGLESAVLIIDDSTRVWPHHRDNLVVVERYMYFPCSRRQFGLPGPSLLEVGHDEREADGMLASILGVIERVHLNFFSRPNPKDVDVREILSLEQRSILGGCKLIFSRIFPVGETQPQMHPLWRMAEQFGAVCTTRMEEDVTHVVAISMGTDKSNWALATGKHLVRPAWVEASAVLYRRANERDFPVPP